MWSLLMSSYELALVELRRLRKIIDFLGNWDLIEADTLSRDTKDVDRVRKLCGVMATVQSDAGKGDELRECFEEFLEKLEELTEETKDEFSR